MGWLCHYYFFFSVSNMKKSSCTTCKCNYCVWEVRQWINIHMTCMLGCTAQISVLFEQDVISEIKISTTSCQILSSFLLLSKVLGTKKLQINIIQYDNYFQYQIANSMIIFKAFLNLPSFFIVLASALSPIYVLFLNYCIMWWSGVIWYSLFGIRVRALI